VCLKGRCEEITLPFRKVFTKKHIRLHIPGTMSGMPEGIAGQADFT